MHTFCTRGYIEAGPAEKSGWKTLVPWTIDAELVRKVEGAGLVLVLILVRIYPPTYRRVKKLQVLIINKDVRKLLELKNGNENPIWIWNDSRLY